MCEFDAVFVLFVKKRQNPMIVAKLSLFYSYFIGGE